MLTETHDIQQLSHAKTALAEARTLDQVKGIRDKAVAVKMYAKAQGLGLEMQNYAAEVKLRAERRAGELLAEMEKNDGGRPKKNLSRGVTGSKEAAPKLADIGIDRMQSSRWQQVATVPEKRFEQHVAETREAKQELTTASVLKIAKTARTEERKSTVKQSTASTVSTLEELVARGEKFACIYGDPPWKYGNQATRASTDNHYSTMTIEDIAALPVGKLAADDAHLHLWVTNGFLFESKALLDAWGFEFRSTFVWCKPQMGIGNYWRNSHEILLTAIRGDAKRFNDRSLMSWGLFDRTQHSAKPEQIRKFIERASHGPRLELFGRRRADGWTVWGNQIEDTMFDTEVA